MPFFHILTVYHRDITAYYKKYKISPRKFYRYSTYCALYFKVIDGNVQKCLKMVRVPIIPYRESYFKNH